MSNKTKEAKMTYHTIEQYSSFPSNDYLMICELIDNSISSFLNKKYNPYENINGLTIKINVDRQNKGNYYFEISDNANGMSEEQLHSCLQFGNSNRKNKDTELNVYGVGLKQSSFFLGKRLDIKTVSKETREGLQVHIDIDEIKSTEDQVVRYSIDSWQNKIINEIIQSNSGTIIKISKLRNGKMTPSKVKHMIKNIEARYCFYLEKGLQIYVTSKEDGENDFDGFLKPSSPLIDNTVKFTEYAIKSKKFIEKDKDAFINNFISKLEANKFLDKNILIDFIGKIRNNEDFTWKIDETILGNIRITGDISILAHREIAKLITGVSQEYTKYRGFSLFQANRAIMCSPNEKGIGMYNYVEDLIQDDISGQNNQKRRWCGRIHIDQLYGAKDENGDRIYLDLTSNKSGIQWLNEQARIDFNEVLKKHMDKYDAILNTYMLAQNESLKPEKKISQKANELADVSVNAAYVKNQTIDEETLQARFEVFLKENDSNDKLIVDIDISSDSKKTDDLFEIAWKNPCECDITLNSNHALWKPILNESLTNDILIEMYKLSIMFILNDYISKYPELVEENSKRINGIFKEIQKEIDGEKTPSKIFSLISNKVCISG